MITRSASGHLVEQGHRVLGGLELVALEDGDHPEVLGDRAVDGLGQLVVGLIHRGVEGDVGDRAAPEQPRGLLLQEPERVGDEWQQVEPHRAVVGQHRLGVAPQDVDHHRMDPPVGGDPEVLELLAPHQLRHGLLHEPPHGVGQRRGQHLRPIGERVGRQLLGVDDREQLLGDLLGHRVGDLGIAGQRSDRVDPGVGIEQRAMGPHPHRGGEDRQARQDGQDVDQHPAPARPDPRQRAVGSHGVLR